MGSAALLGASSLPASAYDFEVDGLFYDVVSFTGLTCSVAQPPEGSVYYGDISIPETVSYNSRTLKVIGIGRGAFGNSSVENVVIGNNVTLIDAGAFSWSSLRSVSFGEGLDSISDSSFEHTNLMEVVLPNNLRAIGLWAFAYSEFLENVKFNDNLKLIRGGAFMDTPLKEALLPKDLEQITSDYIGYSTTIGAFQNCQQLQNVMLPESIKTIGMNTFCNTPSLRSITIPCQISSIGESAFRESGLIEILGGEGIESIGREAFEDCLSLSKVTLGPNLKEIGFRAFKGCEKISVINSYNIEPPYMEMHDDYNWGTPDNVAWEPKVYINSTLYVPAGASAAYAVATGWVEFWNVQDTLDNSESQFTYQVVTAVPDGHGSILINDMDVSKWYAVGGSDIIFTIKPDFGYELASIYVNSEDAQSEVSDNVLTLGNVSGNILLTVAFRRIYVPLSISTADSGVVTSDVAYGTQTSYTIVPAEGWKVNSVWFNGDDVTGELTDGAYLTPGITMPSTLNVVFEKDGSGAASEVSANAPRIRVEGKTIRILNVNDGESTFVYNTNGVLLLQTKEKEFNLPYDGTCLIKVGEHTFKTMI